MKSISLVLALLILPSCSGGGAFLAYFGEALYRKNTRATATPSLDFGADFAIPGLAMVERVEALPATTSNSMPNGTYTYNGFAGFGVGSVSSLSELTRLSKMTLSANFQTNTFSGSMTKSTNEAHNSTYNGTINMSGSISGNTFSGLHSGVWTMDTSNNGYVERPYNDTVSGIFGGSGATGMAGVTNSTFAGVGVTGLLVGER